MPRVSWSQDSGSATVPARVPPPIDPSNRGTYRDDALIVVPAQVLDARRASVSDMIRPRAVENGTGSSCDEHSVQFWGDLAWNVSDTALG